METIKIIFEVGYGLYVMGMGIIILRGLGRKDYRDPESGSHVPPSKAGAPPKK